MRKVWCSWNVQDVRIGESDFGLFKQWVLFTLRTATCDNSNVRCVWLLRHLIADHLSWFKDSTDAGRLRTVEDFVKARGEKVRRGEMKIKDGEEGVLEFTES